MTIKDLAHELQTSEQFCRVAIFAGKFPFAFCVGEGKRMKYYINEERFKLWKEGKL